MPTEASSSLELPDPLHAYSYLSLFPRNCRNLSVVAKPTELGDLEAVHNVLRTVELKEASRNKEQARMILESSVENVPVEVAVSEAVQKEIEGDGVANDEIARKRRPGLGRMQAKFNFNRRVSQPAVLSEPKLDITKLEDPEEFFLAHERLENAKKELRKQSGILSEIDLDENDMSLTARPRRPGLPRRSKATYKHRFSYVASNDEVLLEPSTMTADKGLSSSLSLPPESVELSQENSKENRPSPNNKKTLPGATDPIEDGVLGGSISEVNGFLDQILSGTYDHLNSEEQLNLLQKQLQINPIIIDNLSHPKLPDIPKYDFRISKDFSKPRKSINDIQAALAGKAALTPGSVCFSASPTLRKSPLSNLSSLKKHISQLKRSKDAFSEFNTDPCSLDGSSPVNHADKHTDSFGRQGDSTSNFEVFTDDADTAAVSKESLNHELLQAPGGLPDPGDDISAMVAGASIILPAKSGCVVGDASGAPKEPPSIAEYYPGSPSNEPSGIQIQPGSDTLVPNSLESDPYLDNSRSLEVELHEKQYGLPEIGSALENDREVNETSKVLERKGKSGPVHEQDTRKNSRKRQKRNGVSSKRNGIVASENVSRDDQRRVTTEQLDNPLEVPNNHPEQLEVLMDGNVPKGSLNKKSQAKDVLSHEQMEHTEEVLHPSKKAKKKELCLRKSIARAGTSFEDGVRRSTRFKTRPLEFWKGERYLFGRLEADSTLPTLIGVKKYSTPAKKEGKEILEVEDLVDGKKYRELIDLASLH